MARFLISHWGIVACGTLALCSCGQKSTPPATDPGVCVPAAELAVPAVTGASALQGVSSAAPPKSAPAAATIPARLYVDISTDMRGFVTPRGKLGSLRNVILAAEAAATNVVSVAPVRCTLGSRVQLVCEKPKESAVLLDAGTPPHDKMKCWWAPVGDPVSCAAQPPVDFTDGRLLSADSSRADAILVRKPLPEKYNPQKPPAPDPLDEARLTVVVLSGLAPGARSANDDPAAGCLLGISPGCVAGALRQRVREGYGAWLTTVNLKFDGTFGSAMPENKLYVDEAARYLESIQQVAAGEAPKYTGLRIGPQRPHPPRTKQEGELGLTQFEYHGVRPLVVLTLSRDANLARRMQQQLVAALRGDPALALPPLTIERVVNSIELAPLGPTKYAIAKAEKSPPGPAGQGDIPPNALQEFRPQQGATDPEGLIVNANCGAKGQGWMTVQVGSAAQDGGLPPYVREATELVGPFAREPLPQRVGLPRSGPSASEHMFYTACQGLAPRAVPWGIQYGLVRTLALDEQAAKTAFWSELSAEKDYAMPERVYGLRDLALAVTEAAISHRTPSGRICLRVQRIQ